MNGREYVIVERKIGFGYEKRDEGETSLMLCRVGRTCLVARRSVSAPLVRHYRAECSYHWATERGGGQVNLGEGG